MSNPHDELNQLIDAVQAGTQPDSLPETPEQRLALDLLRLVDDIEPDAELRQHVERMTNLSDQKQGVQPVNNRTKRDPLQLFAYSAAAAAILAVLTLTVPPLRTFAQDLFDSLFNRADSDVVAFETPIPVAQPTPAANTVFATPGTLADVQADFAVKEPTYLPAGYELIDASNPAPGMVTLMYARNGYGLLISQTLIADAPEFEVGASAEIIPVQIGAVTGEYVAGLWKIEVEPNGGAGEFRAREWTTDIAYEQMRWVEDGIVYWMHSVLGTGTDLSLDEWVAIAESLQ